MPVSINPSGKRILEPIDRISEILFGLIMVMTFTGSLSVSEAGRHDVRAMLVGALGCNLAWGIIDAVLYLMGCLAEKGRNLSAFLAVRDQTDPDQARAALAQALPPVIAEALKPEELDSLRDRLRQLPAPPSGPRLTKDDWLGGLGVFALVFLSTLPVALPFLFIHDPALALRVSNGIAIGLLFTAGVAFGILTKRSPWLVGLAMVILGGLLVALTIALGG
jgi:VIT1/CCC1 family predicted Fe2+/Mn2+ transporter